MRLLIDLHIQGRTKKSRILFAPCLGNGSCSGVGDKEEATLYNKVPLRYLFARLKGVSGILEATDIVSLLSSTLG